jgi:replicative DNA helicase
MRKEEVNGFLPPQDLDMEKDLIGCLLVDNSIIGKVSDIISIDTFYSLQHQVIYEAMYNLFKKNMNIDYLVVCNELKRLNKIDSAGGIEYIKGLSDLVSISNYDTYAKLLEEKAIGRRTISACNETIKKILKGEDDIFKIVNEHTDNVFKNQSSIMSAKNITPEYIGGLLVDSMMEGMNGSGIIGVPFGVPAIDEYTSGKKGGRLYTIGARTRHGKSALAAAFMYNAARIEHPDFGKDTSIVKNSLYPTAFISMEMANTEVFARLVSMEIKKTWNKRVPYSRIENGRLEDWQSDMVIKAVNILSQRGIYIDDSPALNPTMVKSKVMKMISDYGIKEVYIDYIQLISDDASKNQNRATQVSGWYTDFKNQAKLFNIPYTILSQVDRATEKTKPVMPVLSDLKDSGGIEEKSDVVMLLYRPEVNEDNPTDENGNSLLKSLIVDVAKNKQGATGKVTIPFDVAINSLDFSDEPIYQNIVRQPQQVVTNFKMFSDKNEDAPF